MAISLLVGGYAAQISKLVAGREGLKRALQQLLILNDEFASLKFAELVIVAQI